ncbi:hypothetical protein EHQ96_06235 [Leptospira levettii]|uniref:hypothetical protein n=1 Tax=Leptospira levettii TaxID=2023178 RepID=UPI0010845C41|nr:hypothetical protein [Leptospira levettii]TGM69139.1 hypothetical protein EHQ96_06235 [Leptospira levettii]TGM75973.1 hypothetical protein EHR04_10475 [Leptospira levettii]
MKTIQLFIIVLSIIFVSCKDKPAAKVESSPEIQEKLKKSREELIKRKLENHSISGFKSKEESVSEFLKELVNSKQRIAQYKSLLNNFEKEFVFFPNIYGENTSLDVTPLEDYRQTFDRLEALGIQRLMESNLEASNLKNIKIVWKGSKQYGNLLIHKIGRIEVIKKGSTIEINQIRSLIEQNGKFKVAVVAP